MGETKKKRLWLAFIGFFVALIGACSAVTSIVAFVDASSGGDSPGVAGGTFFAVAALLVIWLGIWIIRRSGV